MPDFVTDAHGNRHWPAGTPGRGRFAPKDAAAAAKKAPAKKATKRTPAGRPRKAAKGGAGDGWAGVRGRLSSATVDELADAFRAISTGAGGPARDRALAELDAELARREGVSELTVQDDHQSRQLDDLLARGWSYLDAYAEVHHLDVAQLQREERLALVDAERRPGERRDATIRRMYAESVYLAWAQAEADTNGNLLSKAGQQENARRTRAGKPLITAASLWSGQAARARKYASDELKEWWESHGGRRTLTEYRAQFTGDRAAAERARMSGQGRDYGV
jgi:hypothetical protein